MRTLRKITLIFVSLLFTVSVAAAQVADCAAQVTAVIESAREACSNLGMNELCYGSSPVNIQSLPNVRLDFSEPGDMVDPALIESFDLDITDGSFGIAVTRFRTLLIDESVTLVAFGDVTVQNNRNVPSDYILLPVSVSTAEGANIREEPSPDAVVVDQLLVGETTNADGRTEDGAWLRLIRRGWVSAEVVRSDYDLSLLKVLPPEPHSVEVVSENFGKSPRTMQTFRVYAEPQESGCEQIPDSGVLIQTAGNTDEALLSVNFDTWVLRGTALIQGTFGDKTTVSVLEGEAFIHLITIPAGQRFTYWLEDSRYEYETAPDYDYVRARYLPLSLLPREIELPFSLGGVIFPFTPGTGFLETIPADGTCTVVWAGDVNLRAGPGTDYPIRQGVPGGYYAEPDARAVGTDGRVWWRLADEIWIAADTTVGGGACAALPLVEPPPLAESG
jgi:uncharacterized protein YraI